MVDQVQQGVPQNGPADLCRDAGQLADASRLDNWFGRFTLFISRTCGKPMTFVTACGVVILWAAMGPSLGYSERWQLVINTATTIITFLMVFVIQNAQYRDTAAIQLKLDELIRVNRDAQNVLLDLEDRTPDELDGLRKEFASLAAADRVTNGDNGPDRKSSAA